MDGYEGVTHAGIAVVARDSGRVLMQQRAWDETDDEDVRGTWEMPGGSLEEGETPEEGAWREFSEETGLPKPEGEVVNGWRNPEGNYQGFVYAVPVERDAFEALNPTKDAADTVNPDDPDRANPDITAWFTVEQMRGLGPALRPEVADMDWSVFDLEAEMTEPETVAARKWFGVIAPEGVKSGDKRMFAPGALRMRSLPLPLTWQKVADSGHKGNITVASIQETWRENGLIWGAGEWMDTPEADEAYALVEHFGRYGVSVDADDLDEFSIEMTEDGTTVFTDARQCSACIVSIPAFAEAFVMNGDYNDFKKDFAGGWGAPSQQIPTRENEGQDECEERDEDGNCIEQEPDAERKEMALDDEESTEEQGEGKPCDPEDDPNCVAEEEHLPEKEVPFRDVSKEERDRLADEGKAMDDGSFPIANEDDLKNAIQAIGRAKDPEAAKRHIKKRAKALGKEDLIPEEWSVSNLETFEQWAETWSSSEGVIQMKDLAPGLTEDGPGWLTHPVDTDRLRDYWVRGPGAAKIGWGTPDDFYRCEANVAEYVKPQYIKGYCANRHYDALGYWPGQAPHKGEAIAMTASATEKEINGVLVGSTEEAPSLTAAAPMKNPPKAWFEDPQLPGPTTLTVTEDGRVFGHLATWGQCHIGLFGECVMLPKSQANYSYFRVGTVETDGGQVRVGPLMLGGKHAPDRMNWRKATEHYDATSQVVADLACGEDEHGVWVAGALREGIDDDTRRELMASGKLSGDWREVVRGSRELELVAALAVNVGGFPIPNVQIAASEGRIVSLVAAGIVEEDPIGEIAIEVAARIEAMKGMDALRSEVYGQEMAALGEEID